MASTNLINVKDVGQTEIQIFRDNHKDNTLTEGGGFYPCCMVDISRLATPIQVTIYHLEIYSLNNK